MELGSDHLFGQRSDCASQLNPAQAPSWVKPCRPNDAAGRPLSRFMHQKRTGGLRPRALISFAPISGRSPCLMLHSKPNVRLGRRLRLLWAVLVLLRAADCDPRQTDGQWAVGPARAKRRAPHLGGLARRETPRDDSQHEKSRSPSPHPGFQIRQVLASRII
jgi:hypothetical protein